MLYAGVDPGKLGALALLDADGRLCQLIRMPLIPGKRAEYDLGAICETLTAWRAANVFVCVEKQQPLPRAMGGAIANYQRGVASGWCWMLAALRIPFHIAPAQSWQRRMLDGVSGTDTKQRAVIAATRLFPGADLRKSPRARKAFDGFADALLLAEYGRRGHHPEAGQKIPLDLNSAAVK